MPRTEEQVQELLHEMFTTADSAEWNLTSEDVRTHRSRRGMPLPDVKVLVLVAAAVILIVVGILVAKGSPSRRSVASGPTTSTSTPTTGGTVSVPAGGVGTQVANAQALMSAAGLQVSTNYVVSNSPSGTVLSQNPTAGSQVSRGSVVSLTVSSGPSDVRVPNLIGLSQVEAGNTLGQSGLNMGTVSSATSNSVAAGLVISESPTSGSSVVPGSSVDIVVSTGQPATTGTGCPGTLPANELCASSTPGG
jgi:serine/threonine-protein kinase